MKVTHRGLAQPDDPIYKQGWTTSIGPQQIEPSETPSKDTPPKPSETSEKDYILEDLKRRNIPVTRESYILYNWMGDYDPSEPLPAELEASLPPELQWKAEDGVLQMKKPEPK